MKYAVRYHKPFKHKKDMNELILEYHGERSRIPLIEEAQEAQKNNQRLIVDLTLPYLSSENIFQTEKDTFKIANDILKGELTLGIRINQLDFLQEVEELRSFKYFFIIEFATSWDKFNTQAALGVSDIYIGEDLAFFFPYLKKQQPKINLRTFPNILQMSDPHKVLRRSTGFFMRPEDVKFYEGYVDVLEFYETDIVRIDTLYDIYTEGSYKSNLNFLIPSLEIDIQNTSIVPNFGKYRLNCQRRCMYKDCYLCDEAFELGQKLTKHNLEFNPNKIRTKESSDFYEYDENI